MTTRETWYLTQDGDTPTLRRAVDDEEVNADFIETIQPGRTVLGLTYEEWRKLPPGPVVVVREDGAPARIETEGDPQGEADG